MRDHRTDPSQDFAEDWLSGYIDNELSEEERRRVEELMSVNPALASNLAELRSNRQLVRNLANQFYSTPDKATSLSPAVPDASRSTSTDRGRLPAVTLGEFQRPEWLSDLEDGLENGLENGISSPGLASNAAPSDRISPTRPRFLLALGASLIGISVIAGLLWMGLDGARDVALIKEQRPETRMESGTAGAMSVDHTAESFEQRAGSFDHDADSSDSSGEVLHRMATPLQSELGLSAEPMPPVDSGFPPASLAGDVPSAAASPESSLSSDSAELAPNWHRSPSWSSRQVLELSSLVKDISLEIEQRSAPKQANKDQAKRDQAKRDMAKRDTSSLETDPQSDARGAAEFALPRDQQAINFVELTVRKESISLLESAMDRLALSPPISEDRIKGEPLILFLSQKEWLLFSQQLATSQVEYSVSTRDFKLERGGFVAPQAQTFQSGGFQAGRSKQSRSEDSGSENRCIVMIVIE